MIFLLGAVVIFHILITVEVIPYTIVWAGKLNTIVEMRKMETISIGINTFMILVLLLKANYINNTIRPWVINALIWIFVVVFAVNTIGNLFAETAFELYFFTALTFISTLLCLRIVLDKGIDNFQDRSL